MTDRAALSAPDAAVAGALRAVRLRCEHQIDPLGLATDRPRFGWQAVSDLRQQVQTAYQIRVADESGGAGQAPLWESESVAGDHGIDRVYAGPALEPLGSYRWQVRLWDRQGQPGPWSDWARFGSGPLAAGHPAGERYDWPAAWIGFDAPRAALEADRAAAGLPPAAPQVTTGAVRKPVAHPLLPRPVRLRQVFELKGSVQRAVWHATALGAMDLFINGQRVAEEYFNPGWTDYRTRVHARSFDVTAFLTSGANVLGAELADGWFSSYIGWEPRRDHYGCKPRFSGLLDLTLADGSRQRVLTDGTWRAATGPTFEADFMMGEAYDARLETDLPWSSPQFDAGAWSAVDLGAAVAPIVGPHPGPPVRAFARLRPQAITEPEPGVYLFDLGQNFAGVVELTLRGAPGQVITLRHGERLDDRGHLYTENLRCARATDTYHCRGDGLVEIWSPRYTFHGFRYVEVRGLTEAPTLDLITGLPLSSDTEVTGAFACSHPMLERLAQNTLWTQRANFIDVPTDCPQRDERLGWTGDAQMYIRTAAMHADIQSFFEKWLIDLEDAQGADGNFPKVAPHLHQPGLTDGGPAWSEAGVICPWVVFERYGDRQILERFYPAMRRFMAFCEARTVPDRLPPETFHCFGDWLDIGDPTPKPVIFTAYFAHAAQLMARIAGMLQKTEDQQHYQDLATEVARVFRRAYVDDSGVVASGSQTAQVLALAFDLVEGDRARQVGDRLVERIEKRGTLSTGFTGTRDLMLVLSKIGRTDLAYRLILSEAFPSWGFTIRHGATSIWERWDGWTPEKGFQTPGMNSFAHYAFGAVYQWMVERIGGIQLIEPGYRRFRIAPQMHADLTHADVTVGSPQGPIRSSWRREGDRFTLTLQVPVGAEALLQLPEGLEALHEGQGATAGPAAEAEGVQADSEGFRVASGHYCFSGRWTA